ncbi:MAG: zf-HC2 domain-containing protein [Fimbriimonadales bacterium]|nr:zf-HC2 domain-containing protein [Fimbriimonadales bacterium]
MQQGKCRWARRHKWRYLDKTLPAPQARQVEAHLAVCIPCRAEFALAQEALDALQQGKPLTPEQQRALQRPQARLSLSKVAAVAILILLGGAGAYLWHTQGEAFWTRLNLRGAVISAPSAAPPMPMPTHAPEPSTQFEPATPLAPPEARPPDAALPKPALNAPTPKPPVNAPPQRRVQRRPHRPAAPPHSRPVTPPAGVVEVYDEAGNLIQRKQVQQKP